MTPVLTSPLSRPSRPRRTCRGGSGSRRAFHPSPPALAPGVGLPEVPAHARIESRRAAGSRRAFVYAQLTYANTGLIYLRASTYDPATAQFLSSDPAVVVTRAPYNYAEDNPLNRGDSTGLSSWNPFSESFWTEGNFISESPLNQIPYYEQEIESYENGCGYLASVAHGLEGAVAGTALFAGGEGADEADITVSDALAGKLGSITRAPLPPGSPSWADIADMSIADVRAAAKANEPGLQDNPQAVD